MSTNFGLHPRKIFIFVFLTVAVLATLSYNTMTSTEAPPNPSMDASGPSTSAQDAPNSKEESTNGAAKGKGKATEGTATAPGAEKKSGGAAEKAKKKAEAAARRAAAVAAKQAGPAVPASSATAAIKKQEVGASGSNSGSSRPGNNAAPGNHRRTGSTHTESRSMPIRGGKQAPIVPKEPPKEDKTVELFRHLYKSRTTTIAGASKDVHPAVLALGQQMSSYVICGSSARLVATMQVFKHVIESYTTPPGNTLTRHFTPHVLSPQIEYLTSCRPLSISMGTAIRWLKLKISKVDPDTSDADAKHELCEAIDEFIQHRVVLADQVIADSTSSQRIKDGDVILTYAKSSIVRQSLVQAHQKGIKFRVIVVDSRPLFEGKALARILVDLGIEVKYCLMSGLVHCIKDATKVLLGAHAMMSNGALFSRVGTAQVAMEASDISIPVIVLCESIKFTEKVALDSIVLNEIAPPDELLLSESSESCGPLSKWRETKRLQLLNLMYDVTPAEYITMIVTELGPPVPPTSVPVLQRLANEGQ